MTKTTIIIIIVAILILGGVLWYAKSKPVTMPGPLSAPASNSPASAQTAPTDLGSTLYNKAANPIQNKLPDTTNPVTNPIQDLYKNPFQ